MTKKSTVTKVPFLNGSLQHWPSYDDVEWRPNEPFEAVLKLTDYERGYSSAILFWDDAEGHRYPMFMVELADLLRATEINQSRVSGWWKGCKRGRNYGVRYLGTEKPEES